MHRKRNFLLKDKSTISPCCSFYHDPISIKKGIMIFLKRGETAVIKELTQFNMLNIFKPIKLVKLMMKDRQQAIALIMF